MSNLFFYGTLRYEKLLNLVLGRRDQALDVVAAELPGHGVFAVENQIFPAIEARIDHVAHGVLVRGLSVDDIAALTYYEGGFDYDLQSMRVLVGDVEEIAEVYFPAPGLWQTGDLWDLQGWVTQWAALTLRAAKEVMAYRGRMSAAEVARCFPSIRTRAAAWVAAQGGDVDPAHDLDTDVIVHQHKHAHLNFFGIEQVDLQFRRFDGSMSPVLNRSALLVGRAAVVLPYDPVCDEVLLIEQFRAAPFLAGDPRPWIWEAVAGLVDPGESPEQAAYREAIEEAGLTLDRLEPVAQVYSSTGSSGEFAHIFIGIGDFSSRVKATGLEVEGEDIRSQVISFDALMQGIDEQQYQNIQLVTAALWLARHRDRLRLQGQFAI